MLLHYTVISFPLPAKITVQCVCRGHGPFLSKHRAGCSWYNPHAPTLYLCFKVARTLLDTPWCVVININKNKSHYLHCICADTERWGRVDAWNWSATSNSLLESITWIQSVLCANKCSDVYKFSVWLVFFFSSPLRLRKSSLYTFCSVHNHQRLCIVCLCEIQVHHLNAK